MKKQVIFKRILSLLLILTPFFSSAYYNGDVGCWNASGSGTVSWAAGNWAIYTAGAWVSNVTYVPLHSDTVYILSGYVMTLNTTAGSDSCYNLTIENGAQLYSNDPANEHNLEVYGAFVSDSGTVGNPGTADGIVFCIDGSNCTISGPGIFDAYRIRKQTKAAPAKATTNLTISMNIRLNYNNLGSKNSDIYNNESGGTGATFNVIFSSGYIDSLWSYGATPYGDISIDGVQGGSNAPDRWGTFTVNGTLVIAGTLFLTSQDTGHTCAWIINSGGTIITNNVNANASGFADGPTSLTMNSGSLLNIVGTPFTSVFSLTNNSYTFFSGSTIEYGASGIQNIDNNLTYVNLTLGGSGTKTANGNLNVAGNLTITSSAVLVPSTNINLGGNWTGYGTGDFTYSGSTVTFNGSSTQTIASTGGGENFANLVMNTIGANADLSSRITIQSPGTLTLTNGIVYADTTGSGSNVVLINSGAGVSGTNNTSFVYGRVSKYGNTAFTFPVGKGSEYRPVSISNLSANDTMTAQYFHQNPTSNYDTSQKSAPIDHVSGAEYWTLISSFSISAALTFQWDTYSEGVTDTANLLIADDPLPGWVSLGHGTTTGTLAKGTLSTPSTTPFTGGQLVAYTFASQSPDPNNPLPVSLLSFTAEAQTHDVLLNWTTASEINNDYFTVEKTGDGINFIYVGEVKGAGTSTSEINYAFLDTTPFPGVSYYRLKQTDFNGNYSYSQLAPVSYNTLQTNMITLFPNPATDKAYLKITWETIAEQTQVRNKTFTLHVFDISGREAMPQQTISLFSGMLQALDVSALPKGVYELQLNNDTEIQRASLVKE